MRKKSKKTSEEILAYRREWREKNKKKHPGKYLLYAAKKRSKDKNLDFNLSYDDIVIPEFCPYLGVKLISNSKRHDSRRCVATIDRIDNSKGYTKDNIQIISHLANSMKSNATKEELILFARKILDEENISN